MCIRSEAGPAGTARPAVLWSRVSVGDGDGRGACPRGVNQPSVHSMARKHSGLLSSPGPLWTPGLAGLGAAQGRSALTLSSSRISGDWNSRPRRYTSRPWKQASVHLLAPGSNPVLPRAGEGLPGERARCPLKTTGQREPSWPAQASTDPEGPGQHSSLRKAQPRPELASGPAGLQPPPDPTCQQVLCHLGPS